MKFTQSSSLGNHSSLLFQLKFDNLEIVTSSIMLAVFIIIIFSIFFIFVGIIYILAWHSAKDKDILGAVIVMWIVVALFLLTIYLGSKSREAAKSAKTGFISQPATSSKI